MEHYQELNTIVDCMNGAIGLFTFGFGIGTLPYYAENTQTLFHFTTFIEKFKFFSFCIYNTGFLLLGARYQSKVRTQCTYTYTINLILSLRTRILPVLPIRFAKLSFSENSCSALSYYQLSVNICFFKPVRAKVYRASFLFTYLTHAQSLESL